MPKPAYDALFGFAIARHNPRNFDSCPTAQTNHHDQFNGPLCRTLCQRVSDKGLNSGRPCGGQIGKVPPDALALMRLGSGGLVVFATQPPAHRVEVDLLRRPTQSRCG